MIKKLAPLATWSLLYLNCGLVDLIMLYSLAERNFTTPKCFVCENLFADCNESAAEMISVKNMLLTVINLVLENSCEIDVTKTTMSKIKLVEAEWFRGIFLSKKDCNKVLLFIFITELRKAHENTVM